MTMARERLRMEREVIDKQCTRKSYCSSMLGHPSRDLNLPIIGSLHLIPIGHGQDQLSLHAMEMRDNQRNGLSEKDIAYSSMWASQSLGFSNIRVRSTRALAACIGRYSAAAPGRRPRSSSLRPRRQVSQYLAVGKSQSHSILKVIS